MTFIVICSTRTSVPVPVTDQEIYIFGKFFFTITVHTFPSILGYNFHILRKDFAFRVQ